MTASRGPSLPPIRYRGIDYAHARANLLFRLVGEELPDAAARPLEQLQVGDGDDWIVALCDAWAALAEVISFYQDRIVNEAFLPTASLESARARIYHSLGHRFPPNAAATTIVAYHLSDAAAGVEAVKRARSQRGGGTGADERERGARAAGAPPPAGPGRAALPAEPGGAALPATTSPAGLPAGQAASGVPAAAAHMPPAGVAAGAPAPQSPAALGVQTQVPSLAQIRALPGPNGRPPTFVTLAPLTAQVTGSRLGVAVKPSAHPPPLGPKTTQLELAGVRTGLTVGQPVLITARDESGAELAASDDYPWIRVLTSVRMDSDRGATRIGWDDELGPTAQSVTAPIVYGFANSSALVGATAPAWSSVPAAAQLATPAADGSRVPVRGGIAQSADGGSTWTVRRDGVPPATEFTAVAAIGGVVLAATASAIYRAAGGGVFEKAAITGPRRFVYFLGGSATRMLAGAATGTVYESIDGGLTWSQVPGGPPVIVDKQVVPTQLPAVPVRCVLELPAADGPVLLAGTDAGLFVYGLFKLGPAHGGARQQPLKLAWRPSTSLTGPVLDLVPAPGSSQLLALAKAGVMSATTPGGSAGAEDWANLKFDPPPGAPAPALALGIADGAVYAGMSGGVAELDPASWAPGPADPVGGRRPQPVTALSRGVTPLLAGTPRSVYRDDPTSGWVSSGATLAFAFDMADAISPDTVEQPAVREGVVAAFADHGIRLAPDWTLEHATSGFTLRSGRDRYGLVGPAAGGWQVWLPAAVSKVTGIASPSSPPSAGAASPSVVTAIGGELETVANDWPGFAVVGNSVELSPPVKKVAPGHPAVVEQRIGKKVVARAVDVTTVTQNSVARFGSQTEVTRLDFAQSLPPDTFPRAATRVWTGAVPLALFAPPAGHAPVLEGKRIELERELSAPVERGRLAVITGSPVGLAVAPLGGASRVAGGKPARVGPVQLDVAGVAVDAGGTAWLATSEGVFPIAPGASHGQPAATGWPASKQGPDAATALVLAGRTPLAGSHAGVYAHVGEQPAGSWRLAGLEGEAVVALAAAGASVVACTAGRKVYWCDDAAAPGGSWAERGAVDEPVVAAAVGPDGSIYVASASCVSSRLQDGSWQTLPQGAAGAQITAMVVDAKGTIWAGTTQGVETLAPGTADWRRDPARMRRVDAACLDQAGAAVVADADGIFRATGQGGGWERLGPVPHTPPAAMVAAPDGSLWLGARAALPLDVAVGHAPLELRHELVFVDMPVDPEDVATLDQGSLPQTVLDAFAEAGKPLDTATLVVAGDSVHGYWRARDASRLYVIALRGVSPGATVSAFANRSVAYPTRTAHTADGLDRWEVEVAGVQGTLRAPHGRVHTLPAANDAPAFAERVRVAKVIPTLGDANVAGAGTTLELEQPLARLYDASTVQVNLNVVAAAQGVPVVTPLGSGDPRVPHQSFAVPSAVAAIDPEAGASPSGGAGTPAGAGSSAVSGPQSSLQVFVGGQPWTRVTSLQQAGPRDQVYAVRTNPDGTATAQFGDGRHGARLPAGRENVVASYIQGGGDAGEAAAGALIQPLDRPQLVSAVHNPTSALVPPIPGAAPLRLAAVRALDRLVTADDYADAARAHAGVASATVDLVGSSAGRALVVTVAREPKAPKDLAERVATALGSAAASGTPVRVVEAHVVRLAARITIIGSGTRLAAHVSAALDGLAARAPGVALFATEVLAAATAVPGVVAANVDGWHRLSMLPESGDSQRAARAHWRPGAPAPDPAELLVLDGHALELSVTAPAPVATA